MLGLALAVWPSVSQWIAERVVARMVYVDEKWRKIHRLTPIVDGQLTGRAGGSVAASICQESEPVIVIFSRRGPQNASGKGRWQHWRSSELPTSCALRIPRLRHWKRP